MLAWPHRMTSRDSAAQDSGLRKQPSARIPRGSATAGRATQRDMTDPAGQDSGPREDSARTPQGVRWVGVGARLIKHCQCEYLQSRIVSGEKKDV